MKFQIGETVWFPRTTMVTTFEPCPECAGTRQIKCIVADGTEYAVDCRTCERGGWEGSRGTIEVSTHTETVEACVITGINVSSDGNELYTSQRGGGYFYEEPSDNVFATEEDALAKASVMAAERTAEAALRNKQKEKDTKSWAWHVTYHRGCIRRAQRDLEHHTAKLTFAQVKAKEA